MEGFRPILSAKITHEAELSLLKYPLMASPKLDGIRIVCHPELGPVTRTLKPLPNRFARGILSSPLYKGFDGEIIVGLPYGAGVMSRTSSGVMSHEGEPNFTYHAFDDLTHWQDSYASRYDDVIGRLNMEVAPPLCEVVKHYQMLRPEDVLEYEQRCLEVGYEGVMLRSPHGKYKFGRSTLKGQELIKMKRFEDDEATIVGFEPLYRNGNTQERDAFGLAKRNSVGANMVADDLLGALICHSDKWGEFNVGSGFDVSLRQEIWHNRESWLGKRFTFKYQPIGTLEKPRIPIWKGLRPQE